MTSMFRQRVSQRIGNARRGIGQSIGVLSNFVTGMRTTRGHRINPIANSANINSNRRSNASIHRSNASIRMSNASHRTKSLNRSHRSNLTFVNTNAGKLKSMNRTFLKLNNSRITKSNRFDTNDISVLTELIHLFNRSNKHGQNIYAINILLKNKKIKVEDKLLLHILNFFPIYEKKDKKYLTSKTANMFLNHISKHNAMLDQWKIFMNNIIHLIENNSISDDGILHIRKFCDFWEETIREETIPSSNNTVEWLLNTCKIIREKINSL